MLCFCPPPSHRQPVYFLQIFESFKTAGCASQLMFARIDAPRFATIYSAKGHWGLLDQLLYTAADAIAPMNDAASSLSGPSRASTALLFSNDQSNDLNRLAHASTIDLQQVVHAVKKAAAEILGAELGGARAFAFALPYHSLLQVLILPPRHICLIHPLRLLP